VLAGAVLWAAFQTLGTSPTVWVDTLIENAFVDRCLRDDECTVVGVGATVGIFHSAGYLHWRALMTWIGLNPNGVYLILLTMSSCGVMLVALAARKLDGRVAAGLAALLMVISNGVPTQVNVISDVAPVPFFGAVFLFVALAAVAQPGFVMTAALAVIASIMSNIYATGLLCGFSALLITLTLPERRWSHAALLIGVFTVTTFALSPATWIVDGRILLSHQPVSNGNAMHPRFVLAIPDVQLTGLAILAWVITAFTSPVLRRKLDVAMIIIAPLFVPLVGGSLAGRLDPQDKYCAHVLASVALILGVTVAAGWRALWRGATRLVGLVDRGAAWWGRFERLAPYGAAAALVLGSVSWRGGETGDFTYRDLASAERELGAVRGWSWSRASRNMKTQDEVVRQSALQWVTEWPEQGKTDELERAYLLKVHPEAVPNPLPPSVRKVAATNRDATLLEFACSWIDWRSFRVCVSDGDEVQEKCAQSGLPEIQNARLDPHTVPGMPFGDAHHPPRRTMTLHLPLKPRDACPQEWIYMPRLPRVCPGHVIGAEGVAAEIESNGRWARLKRKEGAAPDAPAEVSIRWDLGLPECSVEYRGYPPFFAEGDPDSVQLLAHLLTRRDL
jgi:hypothetical protein